VQLKKKKKKHGLCVGKVISEIQVTATTKKCSPKNMPWLCVVVKLLRVAAAVVRADLGTVHTGSEPWGHSHDAGFISTENVEASIEIPKEGLEGQVGIPASCPQQGSVLGL
jgi:hypothetical protein